ncbi:MAG: GTPase Era [Clostridiales bacterium]|nr:GTPase Era [Clostridiales bacterium]
MNITKTGMFSIVGRPNVGKSTLLNALAGQKIAITSSKPQTTRSRISAIVNRDNTQYIFMDTPGFHKPRTVLGDFMVKVVEQSIPDADGIILVVEPRAAGVQEEQLIKNIEASGVPCILVINKIDTLKNKESLLEVISDYAPRLDFHAVIPVSARTKEGIDILNSEIESLTVEGEALFPEDMVSDQPEKMIIAEIIREKALRLLDREVPHGIAVEIELFEEQENGIIEISAVIYVEKQSHKGIVIGRQGAMLKAIGEQARADIEKLFGTKVFLQTWVKVKEGWRNNRFFMRNFGYEQD